MTFIGNKEVGQMLYGATEIGEAWTMINGVLTKVFSSKPVGRAPEFQVSRTSSFVLPMGPQHNTSPVWTASTGGPIINADNSVNPQWADGGAVTVRAVVGHPVSSRYAIGIALHRNGVQVHSNSVDAGPTSTTVVLNLPDSGESTSVYALTLYGQDSNAAKRTITSALLTVTPA